MPTYAYNGVDVLYNKSSTPEITLAHSDVIEGATDVYIALHLYDNKSYAGGWSFTHDKIPSTTGEISADFGTISPFELVRSRELDDGNWSTLYIYKTTYIPESDFSGDVTISIPSSGVFTYKYQHVTSTYLDSNFVLRQREETRYGSVTGGDTVVASVDTEIIYDLDAVTDVAEGSVWTALLSTKNVPDGTEVFYELREAGSAVLESGDFDGPTSGSVVIQNGVASISVSISEDLTTEGDETFELVLLDSNSRVLTQTSFLVSDTSQTPYNVIDASAGGGILGTNDLDRIEGGDNAMFVSAGGGDDLIIDSTQADRLVGDAGNDTIESSSGADWLQGELGNDELVITSDSYWGAESNAVNTTLIDLSRGARNIAKFDIQGLGKLEKVLDGGFDSDTIVMGDEGEALFLHDALADFYPDDGLNLQLDSKGRESTARILSVEEIYAGGGDDLIDMTSPDYSYDVGLTAYGESGNDTIWATKNNDTLYGGTGNDTLFGDAGDDVLYGGEGADRFEFTVGSGSDLIQDFDVFSDTLVFYARNRIGFNGPGDATEVDLRNGQVTWEDVTIDLNDANLNNLDELNVEFLMV